MNARSLVILLLLSVLQVDGTSVPAECKIYHPTPVLNFTLTPQNVTHPSYGPGWLPKSAAPAMTPTKVPTSDEICITKTQPDIVTQSGNYSTTGDILRITEMSQDGNTVKFKVRQEWTPNTIEQILVKFKEVGGTTPVCKRYDAAVAGPLTTTFTAACTNMSATVTVIARDTTVFASETTYQAPTVCGSFPAGKTISITYNVPCNPGCGVTVTAAPTNAPVKTTTKSPTKAPTKNPTTKNPTKGPTKKPTTKSPTKAPTKNPTTKNPTKGPTKRPTTKSPTKAPTKNPTTKSPTKAPTKSPTKSPTKVPTKKPSKAPTSSPIGPSNIQPACLSGSVTLVNTTGINATYSAMPVKIVSQMNATVTVSIEQNWKAAAISWVATDFTNSSNISQCQKVNEVGPGTVNYLSPITAKCVNGVTSITVYIHDGSYASSPDITGQIPGRCNPSNDVGQKASFMFSVPCNACPSGQSFPATAPKSPTKTPTKSPSKVPTKRPTKAPTKSPTKSPTKGPTKSPTRGPTKSPTKKPTKSPATKAPTKSPTKSPTKAPTKSPTKKPTKAPTKSPTKPPTKSPTKKPTKAPTKSPTTVTVSSASLPTRAPTSAPTVCVPRLNITQVGRYGSIEPAGKLLKITQQSNDGMSVRFVVMQEYKLTPLQLVAVQYEDINWGAKCSRYALAPGGAIAGANILAKCTNGWANVTVFARDDCFSSVPTYTLPATCGSEVGNTVWQSFRVPCSPGCPGISLINEPLPTSPPTKAPVRAPSKQPTKRPTKAPTKRPTPLPTKKPTAAPIAATPCVPLTLKETKKSGNVTAAAPIISNIRQFPGATTVTFTVSQWYKLTNLAYLGVEYQDAQPATSATSCRTMTSVPSGAYGLDFTAKCVNNTAIVRVYGYDDCFTSLPATTIPAICSPPGTGKSLATEFSVPCSTGC